MSAATTTVTFQSLDQEAREHKLTWPQFQAKLAQLHTGGGIAAPQGSTAPPPAVAGRQAPAELFPGENSIPVIGKVGELAGEAGEAVGGFFKKREEEVGEEAVKGAIGFIKPVATKLTLYAVLIFAGLALMVFGVEQLLKPAGGPDLTGRLKKAALFA